MRRIIVIALLSVLAADVRRAAACSCGLPGGPMSPADGATGVPTNVTVFYDVTLEPITQVDLVAMGSTQSIPVTITQHGTFIAVTSAAPLAAHTAYQVTALAASGPRMTTFTTGDADDSAPPAFAGITMITPETIGFQPQGSGSGVCVACGIVMHDGLVSRMHFDFADPPSDVVLLSMTVFDGATQVAEIGMTPESAHDRLLGFNSCGGVSPGLDPGKTYCAHLTAYDAAGNAAGTSAMACSAAATCKPAPDTCSIPDTCEPPDTMAGGGEPGGCNTDGTPGAVLALAGVLAIAWSRRRRAHAL